MCASHQLPSTALPPPASSPPTICSAVQVVRPLGLHLGGACGLKGWPLVWQPLGSRRIRLQRVERQCTVSGYGSCSPAFSAVTTVAARPYVWAEERPGLGSTGDLAT